MIGSVIALIGLLAMVGACGIEALQDRTPRRQTAPEEIRAIHRDKLWWATKRTRKERFHVVDLLLLARRRREGRS